MQTIVGMSSWCTGCCGETPGVPVRNVVDEVISSARVQRVRGGGSLSVSGRQIGINFDETGVCEPYLRGHVCCVVSNSRRRSVRWRSQKVLHQAGTTNKRRVVVGS